MAFDPDKSAAYMRLIERQKYTRVDRAIRNRRDNERRQRGEVSTELSAGMPRGWQAIALATAIATEEDTT